MDSVRTGLSDPDFLSWVVETLIPSLVAHRKVGLDTNYRVGLNDLNHRIGVLIKQDLLKDSNPALTEWRLDRLYEQIETEMRVAAPYTFAVYPTRRLSVADAV